MRTLITGLTLLVPATLILAGACADTDYDCEDTLSCPGDTTTGGGSAGTAGIGGTGGGGTSGTGGTSTTTSASGGTSGTGGSTTGGGEAGDTGLAGAAGAGGSPPMCEGELLPGDDACVVDEQYGVFVAPSGDDATGDGTREAPFATLRKGADAASESGKRVYACATEGEYAAALSLGEAHDGLELYGSFDCDDWSYDATLRATVAPESGVALTVSEIETSLEVDGFTFESADATEPGASSIAGEIRDSSGVVLRNVALRAGAGAAGAPGVTENFTYPEKALLDGMDGEADAGGVSDTVNCPAGDTTRGGIGGFPPPIEMNDGADGTPNHGVPGGEGGVAGGSCSTGIGQPGANAPPGPDGGGATTLGSLNDGTWAPSGGIDGTPGRPGQGGGGGAGATNGGGGSGGAGGCGGAGGRAGGGGGASIGLLSVDAEVTLVDSEVASSDAGDGGAGSPGQEGQQEFGSAGDSFGDACDGGRGGLGGNGGNAGGGAGGISVGILFDGDAPVQTNTVVTEGTAGLAGEGAGDDNDGMVGVAQPDLNLADL